MMARRFSFLILLFCSLSRLDFAVAQDPLAATAEYYFSRQDYQQALELWVQILKRHPQNIDALLRIGELRLHFEGREAFRTTLFDFLQKHGADLSRPALERIESRWRELQATFLTDQGQERYLQALAKLKRQDYEGAREFLEQAHGLEKGNVKILLEKAKCEKALGLLQQFYVTLKEAHKNDPFDHSLLEDLIEAQVYFKDFQQVLAVSMKVTPSSTRQSVGIGVALMKVGEPQKALKLLREIVEAEKEKEVPPIVFYAVGSILSRSPNNRGEALSYLKRFLAEANRAAKAEKGWDPYQTQDYIDPAKQLLATLEMT